MKIHGHFHMSYMFLRRKCTELQPIKRNQCRKKSKKMPKKSPFLTFKFRNFRSKNQKSGSIGVMRTQLLTRLYSKKRPENSILGEFWGGGGRDFFDFGPLKTHFFLKNRQKDLATGNMDPKYYQKNDLNTKSSF